MASDRTTAAFSRRVHDLLDNTEFRVMQSGEDREAVFRMRHEGYVREGYTEATQDGLYSDFLDEKPNNPIIGVFIAGRLVSSIRLSVLTPECRWGPSMATYADLLHPMLDAGLVMIDPSRFVIDKRTVRDFPELPYITMKAPTMACEHYLADKCLTIIRPAHSGFYRKIYDSKLIGEPVQYEKPKMWVQLMSCDVPELRSNLYLRYPFLSSNYLERRALFGPAGRMIGIDSGLANVAIAA